jgi:hypothetical protein
MRGILMRWSFEYAVAGPFPGAWRVGPRLMQFVKDNEWYKVIRVTGPSHNLLGIVFAEGGFQADLRVEALPTNAGIPAQLSEQDVRRYVEAGVADANQEFQAHYSISKIQFIPTDTPPASVYRMLARRIVERLVTTADGHF